MVQGVEEESNLIAWEVCNEPEWIVETYHVATWFELQRFAGLIASAIHNVSSKYVTLGSASLKWNSDVSPAQGNYWKDSAL